jgi:hypothetical protein
MSLYHSCNLSKAADNAFEAVMENLSNLYLVHSEVTKHGLQDHLEMRIFD